MAATRVELHATDIDDWRITFVDTGLHSNIGQRLLRVRKHLEDEQVFLANYADGLTDLPVDRMIADFQRQRVVASFAGGPGRRASTPSMRRRTAIATGIGGMSSTGVLINGGFFVLRQEIFDYIEEGEELVEQPVPAADRQARCSRVYRSGFWQRDGHLQGQDHLLIRMEARGECPWMVWEALRAIGRSAFGRLRDRELRLPRCPAGWPAFRREG